MRKQWIAMVVAIFGLVAVSANASWAMGKKKETHRAPAKKHASLSAGQEETGAGIAAASKEQATAQVGTPAATPASSQEHGGKEHAGAPPTRSYP